MQATLLSILQYAVVAYLLLAAGFYFLSDSIIFQPHAASYQDGPNIIKLTLPNGKKISGVYLPNPAASFTILFSHGNAEDVGTLLPLLTLFQQHGYAIFAYDYEGYGTSTGMPSEKNTYQDITAAYNYLTKTLKIAPEHIILYGRSLGTGPSTYLATQVPVKALILESPFISAFRVQTRVPLFPFDKYPNLSNISILKIPLLVIQGSRDSVIPPWHGKKIYAKAKGFKQAFWVSGADHNNILDVAKEKYWQALENFTHHLSNDHEKTT